MTRNLWAIGFLLGGAIIYHAQDPGSGERNGQVQVRAWKVGDTLPGSSRIQPRTEEFVSFTQRDGQRKFVALLTRTVEIGQQTARPIIRLIQRYETPDGVTTDTSIVDRRTLEPLTYSSESATQKEAFDFTTSHVKGMITPTQGEPKVFEASFDFPVFNGVILDEILKALPLAEGYAVSFRAHNPGKQFFTFALRVVSSERIQTIDNRSIDTWVVRVEGGAPTTLWIAKQSQELVLQKVELKGGAEFWRVRLYSKNLTDQ